MASLLRDVGDRLGHIDERNGTGGEVHGLAMLKERAPTGELENYVIVLSAIAARITLRSLDAGRIVALHACRVAADVDGPEPAKISGFHLANSQARSIALFEEAAKVMQHPRCMNCHPAGERPRQTDKRRLHEPLVVRGKDGHGAARMTCSACHGGTNFDPARVPGNPHWALAPASMAWEGKTIGEICKQLKDPHSGTAAGTSPPFFSMSPRQCRQNAARAAVRSQFAASWGPPFDSKSSGSPRRRL